MDYYIFCTNLKISLDLQTNIEKYLEEIADVSSGYKSLTADIKLVDMKYSVKITLTGDSDTIESEMKEGADLNHTLSLSSQDLKNKVLTRFVLSAS